MSERLVTRCPRCRTAFIVRPEQLAVRRGLVRCGRCETVFRARTRPYVKAGVPEPPAPAAPPALAEQIAGQAVPLPQTAPVRARAGAVWTMGAVALLLALVAQAIHFFAPRMLVLLPEARPVLAQACRALACRADLPIDLGKTDLIRAQVLLRENTQRGLMVSAALVNRASHLQRWPAIELTLNDSHGEVLARRTYAPSEFVASADALQRGLPPKIAVPVEFAVARPHVEPAGYELRLVSPD